MFTLLVILTLIAAVLLIGIVLIQKSKGGGLSSTFAGSNQIMGVRRTNNFIEKVTWSLAGAIAVLAILCSYTQTDSIETHARVKATTTQRPVAGTNYNANAAATNAPAAQQPAAPAK